MVYNIRQISARTPMRNNTRQREHEEDNAFSRWLGTVHKNENTPPATGAQVQTSLEDLLVLHDRNYTPPRKPVTRGLDAYETQQVNDKEGEAANDGQYEFEFMRPHLNAKI